MTFSLDGNTITIEQGSTFSLSINYQDSGGSTIDLSSYSARMQAREEAGSTSTIFSISSASEITLGASDPNLLVTLTATTTAALAAPWRGIYDLEIESPSGVVTKLLKGVLLVESEVTR